MWRSPKKRRVESTSIRSSLGASPTRHKSPVQPASLVADIEDLHIGSSFFSELDIGGIKKTADTEEMAKFSTEKFTFIRIESVQSRRHDTSGDLEVLLYGKFNKNEKPTTVIVRGLWVDCDYQAGAMISVTPPTISPEIIIDGTDGCFLVYHPATLISITTVADAVSCLRKSALSIKMQSAAVENPPTIHLVSGSIAHDVFEQGILHPDKLENVTDLITSAVKRYLTTILACGESELSVQSKVVDILTSFRPWCSKFLRDEPHPDANVLDELKANLPDTSRSICVPTVYSLEESITSYGFGLKGKIDAVVMIRFQTPRDGKHSLMVPLELKTGKSTSSTAHRAQTLLYTLLLSDRYDFPVRMGLLYYVASNILLRISARSDELQALVMVRNRLAASCQRDSTLPKPISNSHNCRQCSQLENCAVMNRLEKEPLTTNEAITAKLETIPKILDDSFYRKWRQLVDLEEEETLQIRKKSFNGQKAILSKCSFGDDQELFTRFHATFELICNDGQSEISQGDPVIVYLESNLEHEVGIGFVLESNCMTVTIGCDRNVGDSLIRARDFDAFQNHHLERATNIGSTFTIRKDETLSGFSLARMNLTRLYGSNYGQLRQLVCDGRPPKFGHCDDIEFPSHLDDDQRAALRHCLSAKEYSLLLGMPGTGKTTTLVELVRVLIKKGAKVLISSYTNSAVDNLLAKINATGVSLLRLGNSDRVDNRLRDRILDGSNFPTVASMKQAVEAAQVFGATCLGSNHPILGLLSFDYCIIDEASQITVPAVLGPIMHAKQFILVGDHNQLPPLVRSSQAISLNLNKSLFQILAEQHPSAVTTLRRQYRMCGDIQLVANKTIYRDQLICGSEAVRTKSLDISQDIRASLFCNACGSATNCWVRKVLDPMKRVIFLDTDELPAMESVVGSSFCNQKEAEIAGNMVSALLACHIDANRICVISAFRPQVKLISESLLDIEVSTVDRYQGRDKDCVILSFVRSNAEHNVYRVFLFILNL